MLDPTTIGKILSSEGFARAHATKKLVEYRRGTESIYFKASGTDHPLVVHGRHAARVSALAACPGVARAKPAAKPYHNSNMRSFDWRQNAGKKPTRYGFDFGFADANALRAFLRSL